MTALTARLDNLAALRRREWCPVGIPYDDAKTLAEEATFETDRGLKLRAVRCDDVGEHTTMYRVFAPFDPLQTLNGEFKSEAHASARPFTHHPWVIDKVEALIPKVLVKLNGVIYKTGEFLQLGIEDGFGAPTPSGPNQNPCFQRWHFKAQLANTGFVVEGWITFYALSPVADIRVAVMWSDRTTPMDDFQVEAVGFETGEIVKFDFALRNGGTSIPVWDGVNWINLISGPLGFIDGSGLPLVGRMLCLPQGGLESAQEAASAVDDEDYDAVDVAPNYDEEAAPTVDAVADAESDGPADAVETDAAPPTPVQQNLAAQIQQDIETLYAASQAPVFGCCGADVWDGKWLAHRNVPRLQASVDLEAQADELWRRHEDRMLQTAPNGFYEKRQIGVTQSPGQTGDQEDFGATKGWMSVTHGDPRWIQFALYNVTADYFRGLMHYESDGARLDPNDHPEWVTWSGYTHWHRGVSKDRLGKAGASGSRRSTTWQGYDDQHRSQNNLAAAFALTGDPLLRFIFEHHSATDIKNVRIVHQQGVGAARAGGRTTLTQQHARWLLDKNSVAWQRFDTLIKDRRDQFFRVWWGDQHPGLVDVLNAKTDPRHGITHEGSPIRSWVAWELGLMLQGFYAAYKYDKDPKWLEAVRRVARTVLKYASFRDTEGWWLCNNIHYPLPGEAGPLSITLAERGDPLPRTFYTQTSTYVNSARGGVAGWTFPVLLMFVETLDDASDPDLPQALDMIQQWTGNQEATDTRKAEWWACVKKVVPDVGAHATY